MIEDMADSMSEIADKLKPEGLRTGFHCHPGEFKKIGDSTVWDIFFTRAKKEVIMQCDLGHMGSAGVDPVAYLTKYPGRASTVHVKPSAKNKRGGLVGDTDDTLNWPEIFKGEPTNIRRKRHAENRPRNSILSRLHRADRSRGSGDRKCRGGCPTAVWSVCA